MSQQQQQQTDADAVWNRQRDMQAADMASRAAMSAAAERQQETLFNPGFYEKVRDPDVDSNVYNWVRDEFGPEFSGSHVSAFRDSNFPLRQELLNANMAERFIAENTPGRLLRENPKLNALAQGLTGTEEHPDPTDNPDYREPLKQRERRIIRAAADAATSYQSLGTEGFGLESVTTATAESRVVDRGNESQNSRLTKLTGKVFQ